MQTDAVLSDTHVLKNFECDFRREIKPSAVLGLFQEIAGEHSEEMGLGFPALKAQGWFWVLSKVYVEFLRRPQVGEKLVVQTWPAPPNKAIFERSFTLCGEDGDVAVRALSRWCVLRADNGRIVPASMLPSPQMEYREVPAVPCEDWRIAEQEGRGKPAYSLRVGNSEYDFNYHVNNIKYADFVFNCFTVQELEGRALRSFQLNYVKQAHEGDLIELYRNDSGNMTEIVGVKNGTETVVAARVSFA